MVKESWRYEYIVIRYVHDPMTQEFINIGVVLYCLDKMRVVVRANMDCSRISKMFGAIDTQQYQRLIKEIKDCVGELNARLATPLPYPDVEVRPILHDLLPSVWPIDDSSIRFSQIGVGITPNTEEQLDKLYNRMVMRYCLE